MESYTVFLCVDDVVKDNTCYVDASATIQELRAADCGDHRGTCYVSMMTPSVHAPRWLELTKISSVDDLMPNETRHRHSLCKNLDTLADQLPPQDVVLNVVWLCVGDEGPAESAGLFATLLRYTMGRGATVRILPANAAHMAEWRRLLEADGAATLRPTLRAALRYPGAAVTDADRLQVTCDAGAWQALLRAAADMHRCADDTPVYLATMDGCDVVEQIRLSSVPERAIAQHRLKVAWIGRRRRLSRSWHAGRSALLVRLLHSSAPAAADRYSRDAWQQLLRRVMSEGAPQCRRVPPACSQQLHFLLMAGPDGTAELVGLDAAVALKGLADARPPLPELSIAQFLIASNTGISVFDRYRSVKELIDGCLPWSQSGSTDPTLWPERRGLAFWDSVHSGGDPSRRRVTDSLVLDADGILGATARQKKLQLEVKNDEIDLTWMTEAPRTPWPESANLRVHGVYYNLTSESEQAEGAAGALRQRCIPNETACTCSVWRSDAVSVQTGNRITVPESSAVAPRRSPIKRLNQGRSGATAGSSLLKPLAGSRKTPQDTLTKPATQRASKPAEKQKSDAGAEQQKQRLRRAIWAALHERHISSRDRLFRGCARRLAAVVRALTLPTAAGAATTRQMLLTARQHVDSVVNIERGADASR